MVALEWLDPPYAGGHWVPEMIALAGGRSVAGEPGRDSRAASWAELAAARPEVVVVMPCGLYAEEAAEQALARRERLESLGAERIYAVDAASSFSRPGPRLVDGTELLAHLLHPDRVPSPDGLGWRELTPRRGERAREPASALGVRLAALRPPARRRRWRRRSRRIPSTSSATGRQARRSANVIRSAASPPPIRPPRWPPTLIPGTPNVNTRLRIT